MSARWPRHRLIRWAATAAAIVASTPAAAADADPPLLARIFGDHAVLQRDRPIGVWGHADRGAQVTVTLAGHSITARVDADGRWTASLPAMPAGGPYVLQASGGGRAQQLSDVMVGDVYLCSGQSNMEFPARLSTGAWGGLAPKPEPMLRYAHIERDSAPAPRDELAHPAPWHIVDADSVGDASAVCFYMARALQRSEHVAVGFIDSDWGGTTIQGWISPYALATVPAYADGARRVALLARDRGAAMMAEEASETSWWRTHDPRWAETRRWSDPLYDDSNWSTVTPTGGWAEGDRADLATFEGVVWLRQTVVLTAAQASGANQVLLGPIAGNDTVWINGRWIGSTGIDWYWRDYALPAGALHAGANTIVIRTLGKGGPTGRPRDRQIKLGDGTIVPLAAAWRYRIAAPLPSKGAPTAPWAVPTSLTTLYNGMIAPIARYGFKLAAWYQGESNVGDTAGYRVLLPLLMRDWRAQTAEADLPFVVAQLSTIGTPSAKPGNSSWAELRDVQAKVVRADPHAALAVTLDVGDRYDIHPTQKLIVGERMARAARAIAYGATAVAGGPEASGVSRAGADLVIAFRNATGLRAYSADTAIGFEACAGTDCRFVAGTIEGERIVLRGAAQPGIDRVRYAWADAPYVNLYNGDDLPAVPFEAPVK